jgi:hypothetical protein
MILTPRDPLAAPEGAGELPALLSRLELIGSPLTGAPDPAYEAGERFLEWITFLGCSPMVELTGVLAEGGDFCHVRLPPISAGPRFLAGSDVAEPICRHCKHRCGDWRRWVESWLKDPRPGACPGCGIPQHPHELHWRKRAVFARTVVEIWGIYPSEAVPAQGLMDALARTTGGPWRHTYLMG